MQTPTQASEAKAAQEATSRKGMNWFRFWMQMLVAMLVFNLIAGLVTWFFIFPRLHPGM